ncbi:MAG: hypothetical protein E2598_01280 [Sphingobium sp.]|nr:hypothetical protein [Sphingobium sp.]
MRMTLLVRSPVVGALSRSALLVGALGMAPALFAQEASGGQNVEQEDAASYNENYNSSLVIPDREVVRSGALSSSLRLDDDDLADPSLRNVRKLWQISDNRRGETVMERRRPEYDPVGLPMGSFRLFPQATVRGNYSNNIFRNKGSKSDVYTTIYGGVTARSTWSRHALILDGSVDQTLYATYSSEDALQYKVNAATRLDISSDAQLNVTLGRQRDVLDRTAIDNDLPDTSLVKADRDNATATLNVVSGNVIARLGGSYSKRDYKDSYNDDGTVLSQQYRDVSDYGLNGRLAYELTPGRRAFVSLAYNRMDHRLATSANRNLRQWEMLAGISSDITSLIRGQIAVGYIIANFDDETKDTRRGLTADVQLDYLYSELTTFTLKGRRSVRNMASVSASAAFVTEVSLGVNHELLRNLILTGEGSYEVADYIDGTNVTKAWTARFRANWMVDRHLRVNGGVNWRKRDMGISVRPDYSNVMADIGISYLF